MLYYVVLRFFKFLTAIGIFRVKIIGGDNISRVTPTIVAANHSGKLDPFFLAMAVDKPIHYMARDAYFKNKLKAFVLKSLAAFPIKKGNYDRESICHAIDLLNTGDIVGMFAIGHKDKNDLGALAQKGCCLIAIKSGINPAIVPVGIDYRIVKGRIFPIAEVVIYCQETIFPGGHGNDIERLNQVLTSEIRKAQKICQETKFIGR
jgi:1-acyl-sn-glycerol-3-phosphate acyltransferase